MLTLALEAAEKRNFEKLATLRRAEGELLRLLAAYLNNDSRFITPELVASLLSDCEVSEEEAVLALLDAAFALDERDTGEYIGRELLPRSLRCLDPAVYRADPYFRNIRVPAKRIGEVEFGEDFYTPYEGFICGNLEPDAFGFAEIPPLGYFTEEFRFPVIRTAGQEWMAIKPNEIETMRAPIAASNGRVLALGLGIGYFAYMSSLRDEVERVTVVERDARTVRLFCEEILPQFPHPEKIEIAEADAFDFLAAHSEEEFDFIFADLWHDVSDGFPLYLRLRRVEEASYKRVGFSYWIEDHILSHLRSLVFSELLSAYRRGAPPPPAVASVTSFDGVREMLSAASLRSLAPNLKRVE